MLVGLAKNLQKQVKIQVDPGPVFRVSPFHVPSRHPNQLSGGRVLHLDGAEAGILSTSVTDNIRVSGQTLRGAKSGGYIRVETVPS